jgi:hypothetical protein
MNVHTSQQTIDYCPNTIFFYPDTDNELESVTQRLKANFSTGVENNPYIIS